MKHEYNFEKLPHPWPFVSEWCNTGSHQRRLFDNKTDAPAIPRYFTTLSVLFFVLMKRLLMTNITEGAFKSRLLNIKETRPNFLPLLKSWTCRPGSASLHLRLYLLWLNVEMDGTSLLPVTVQIKAEIQLSVRLITTRTIIKIILWLKTDKQLIGMFQLHHIVFLIWRLVVTQTKIKEWLLNFHVPGSQEHDL